MWEVKKITEGTKAGKFAVKHTNGSVHAYFRIKRVAKLEAIHLNGKAECR